MFPIHSYLPLSLENMDLDLTRSWKVHPLLTHCIMWLIGLCQNVEFLASK